VSQNDALVWMQQGLGEVSDSVVLDSECVPLGSECVPLDSERVPLDSELIPLGSNRALKTSESLAEAIMVRIVARSLHSTHEEARIVESKSFEFE
jgi:hypothetical protein